jgi:RNA polymerase sigma-70 factor (ECF subfamily)
LGDTCDVEDLSQEAWLRLGRIDPSQIEDLDAWLITVVRRLALDALNAAWRRRELSVGPQLPEGLAGVYEARSEERAAELDRVEAAMRTVLENLSPSERAPFVLHDALGLGFAEIAALVGRSPQACRQLAVRGRRHLVVRSHRFTIDDEHCLHATSAFVEASAGGELAAVVAAFEAPRRVH